MNHITCLEANGDLDADLKPPVHYPTGCLLGCVYVKDVLSQQEYSSAYPKGLSESPYVFVCESPMELTVKIPVQGKHKIWKLDSSLHRSVKNALKFG